MHSTVVLLGEEQITIDLTQGGNHPVAAGLIERAHLFQMTEKMPLVEKRGEDFLRQHRLAAGEDVRAVGKRADGAGGHHHVPHAQRWHDGFAEGAHKDHPVMLVEAFQRRQHFAGVVKFAVIIIFDNPRLVL